MDKGNDVGNVFGCPGVLSCRFNINRRRVRHKSLDELIRQLGHGNPLLMSGLDHFVIHVGKVRNVVDLVALKLKVATNGIKGDGTTRVANVNIVINGGTTDIHINNPRVEGLKFFFLPG